MNKRTVTPKEKIMKTCLLAALMIASSTAFAQQTIPLSGGKPRTEVIALNNGFIIDAVLPEAQLFSAEHNGQLFQQLLLNGYQHSMVVGDPELPVINRLIEIPAGASIEVKILSTEKEVIHLNDYGTGKLFPVQESVSKSVDPATVPFRMNTDVYQTNAYVANELAKTEVLGKMRGTTIGRLTLSPVSYNPVTNELLVTTAFRVQVSYTNVDSKKQSDVKAQYYSPAFSGAFSKMIPAGTPGPQKDQIVTYPMTYVIVADPMFEEALQPFIEWKTKKGFNVIEAYTNNPQVGTTTVSIKSYLNGLYQAGTASNPVPSYILLVGDIDQIPSFQGAGHVTDLYYAEYDGGGDYFPDVYYGRFSANNVAQLQPQIDKTLEYEQYAFPDDSFLNHVILISGVDANFAPTHGNGQINYGTNEYFNANHGFIPHVWLYPASNGAVEQDIITALNNGCSFMNYTAHGYETGWVDPDISTSDVSSFNNAHKYPLMIGNCCLTNTFTVSECFGEKLMRAQNKGAIGYIGGSNVTLWDEDYWWGVGYKDVSVNPDYDDQNLGSYDCVFHENDEPTSQWYVTQSQMIFAGNMAVTTSGSGNAEYYWQIYHLMGDPSLMPYMTEADPMTVTHVAQDVVGTSSLTVTAEPYTYIAVSLNGELLDAEYTHAGSSVTLNFPAVNNVDVLDVVATKQNKQPYVGSVQLIESGLSVQDHENDLFSIHPNPATDRLYIDFKMSESENQTIVVRDFQAKEILRQNVPVQSASASLSVSNLAKGAYTIECFNSEAATLKKFIKL